MANLVWVDWVLVIIAGSFIMKNTHKYFLFQIISFCGWLLTYYSVANYNTFMIINAEWLDFLAIKYRIPIYKTIAFVATIIIFNIFAVILEILFPPRQQHIIFERLAGICSGLLKCCIFSSFVISNVHYLADEKILKIINSSYLLSTVQKISDIMSKFVFMLINTL